MTLASWEAKGWLRQYRISKQEILELLSSAESDLMDARRDMPTEWVFSLSFASVMHLCNILLYTAGYHAEQERHLRAIQALPLILGEDHQSDADYLESCLSLRNQKPLAQSSPVTSQQADQLVYFVGEFYLSVCEWLRNRDSALVVNADIGLVKGGRGLSLVEA